MRSCGLTWAGSPPNTMDSIYVMGERTKDDVTGFAPEAPPLPDTDSQAVNEFMVHLRLILPNAYEALMAKHRRIVHGELILTHPEGWIAESLYNLSRSASHARLSQNCEAGYSALQRWWNEHTRSAA